MGVGAAGGGASGEGAAGDDAWVACGGGAVVVVGWWWDLGATPPWNIYRAVPLALGFVAGVDLGLRPRL